MHATLRRRSTRPSPLTELGHMFRAFREHTEAIQTLKVALKELAAVMLEDLKERDSAGGALDRIDDLERSRARWEAELEGMILKAEGTLKAANNAESRARTMKRHAENYVDDYEPDRDPEETAQRKLVPGGDAQLGGANRVQPVPVGVEDDPKAHVTRMKFLA